MKKCYVIYDLVNKKYWYGYFTNKQWTDQIQDAKFFNDMEDAEIYLEGNSEFEIEIPFAIQEIFVK